jgi:hypothetical protein
MAGTEIPLYAFADLNNNGKTDVVILEKQTYNGKYYLHWKEFIDYNNLVFLLPLHRRNTEAVNVNGG